MSVNNALLKRLALHSVVVLRAELLEALAPWKLDHLGVGAGTVITLNCALGAGRARAKAA